MSHSYFMGQRDILKHNNPWNGNVFSSCQMVITKKNPGCPKFITYLAHPYQPNYTVYFKRVYLIVDFCIITT